LASDDVEEQIPLRAHQHQRLGTAVNDLKITRYMHPFEYPLAPPKVVDFFIEYYGPTNRAHSSLTDDGRKALHDDLTAL